MIACKYRTLWLDIHMIYSDLLTCRVETEDCMQERQYFLGPYLSLTTDRPGLRKVLQIALSNKLLQVVVHASC